MQKFNSLRFVAGLALLFAVCCGGSVTAEWVAYNDSIRAPGGDGTAANATSWTVHNGDSSLSTGLLKDFGTGLDTDVTVTFSMNTQGLRITSNGGDDPWPDTDAYTSFYDIVDLDGYLLYYGNFGWSVDIVFTGLNPTKKYTFIGTAIRSTSHPQRQTMVTLSDHDSAVNNSSSGIVAADGDTAIFLAGGNNTDVTGHVVRWDNIKVADDGLGTFTVNARASDYTNSLSTSENGRAYPLGAFMLQEVEDYSCPLGDLDENCLVDIADLLIFGGSWLDNIVGGANLDDQGNVDGADFAIMADNWQINAQTGSLRVILDDPIPPGAQWRVDDGEWKTSGYFEWGLPVGLHTVTFSDVTDWITPQPRDVQIDYNQTTTINEAYPLGTGTLRVTITAEDPAVIDDARWRVDGGDWQLSGAVVELPVGNHGVDFLPVPGWFTPANKEAWIFIDEQTELSGRYEPAPTLLINEIMASNTSAGGIPDPQDGQYYDWFEIYNITGSAIDIGGMYVADSQDELWRIPTGHPETIIPAGGYLLFWAAGDEHGDRPLYVDFRLDADGDTLSLYDVDGTTLLDRVIIDDHLSNISYGRYPDGAPDLFFFASASPGASNNGAGTFDGHVADTKFSHDRGFYDASFDVTITTATPGATIYYTLDDGADPINPDGSPTSTAITYTVPVTITTTKSLRAAAALTGWLPTNIDTQSYIFLDDVLLQDGTGLPPHALWGDNGNPDWAMDPDVIDDEPFTDDDGLPFTVKDAMLAAPTLVLTMNWDDWFGAGGPGIYIAGESAERVCSAELISPDGSEDGFQVNCTIQIAGGTSVNRSLGGNWKMDKLSMRLKFRPRLDDGTPTGGPGRLGYKLFADSKIDSFNTVTVDARMNMSWAYGGNSNPGYQQPHAQYTRDQFPGDIHNAMGGYSPHGRPVHLYLNGVYWGLYFVHERPDGAFSSSYLGGEKDDYDVLKHNNGTGSVVGFDDDWPAKVQAAANYDALTDAANMGLSDMGNYLAVQDLLDVEDFIDYMIMNFYIGNTDWAQHNWYAGRNRVDPDGKWRYHSWDPEKCLQEIGDNVTGKDNGDGSPTDLHQDLSNNADYRLRFADRVHRHFFNNGILEPNNIVSLYQRQIDILDRIVVAESVRWGDNQEPRGYPTYTRDPYWTTERDRILEEYFPYRSGIVFYQLKDRGLYPNTIAPVFNQHGGAVPSGFDLEITAPAGTIYYTLDGSDLHTWPDTDTNVTLVEEAAFKSVLVPTSDIGTDWRGGNEPYSENWVSGTGGVGYDTDPRYDPFIGIDVIAMQDTYNTCYIRIPFNVSAQDIADFNFMTLRVRYDDGFVAYLNGVEIDRANFSGDPQWNSGSYDSHTDSQAEVLQDFDVTDSLGLLQNGSNILAVHGLNYSGNQSDFLISVELVAGHNEAGISPSAIEYTGPVSLDSSCTVKARVLDGSIWSALTEATFAVGPVAESLRITELMYHPTDPTQAEKDAAGDQNLTGEDFEFIELKNIGAAAINLNLVHFTDGIDFTFGDYSLAAGSYIVLVKNQAAFQARYPGVSPAIIAGTYTGSLNNGGEEIVLRDAIGTEIHDFDYNDAWYDITDGGGFSLTIKDASATDPDLWDEKAGWRPSAAVDGSPGWDDTGDVPEIGAIVINEILAHSHLTAPDWIELHNTTGSPINIGNWYLSDNAGDLMRYKIASGTSIAADGYIVFYEDIHFGSASSDPGVNTPFALSENGETVYLHSGDGSGLTGYSEEEAFDASESNVAFGRYQKSTGTFNFVAMSSNTPGFNIPPYENAYPKVGPIVINEIMYHPIDAGGDAEYLELKNITGSPVTLYDSDPTVMEPWKMTDGIEYTFPSGSPTTIAAGDYFLLIKDLAAFTAEYGAPVCDYAVWTTGSLSNGGEKVEISMPGDVDGSVRQYIRVDRVNYDDAVPWPTEPDDGITGTTLSRISPSNYGNDVINWQSAATTPGTVNP